MRIKRRKQMRLDELIKYVWERPVLEKRVFLGNHGQRVVFDNVGGFYPSGYAYSPDTTFTVDVEEELTEDTLIQDLADVFFDPLVGGPNIEYHTDCIKNIKQDGMETYSLAIFYKDTIIWNKDTGIPAEGVIECS